MEDVSRALSHPTRAWIINCLLRADRPLSAADIVDSSGGGAMKHRIERHLRQLRSLGIVTPAACGTSKRSAQTSPYRMARKLMP